MKLCNNEGKPVIVATQMLESMRQNPRPTRAEVSDVANAIMEGADAIMLSGETAVGSYPIEAVKIMTRVARGYDKKVRTNLQIGQPANSISLFISQAAFFATNTLNVKLIIAPTRSGYTPKNISRFKPKCPIIAITANERRLRALRLSWGVYPVVDERNDEELHFKIYHQVKQRAKGLKPDDKVVVTAGYHQHKGAKTNLLEIYNVKDILQWFKH